MDGNLIIQTKRTRKIPFVNFINCSISNNEDLYIKPLTKIKTSSQQIIRGCQTLGLLCKRFTQIITSSFEVCNNGFRYNLT